ncbi:MAG: chlororespiratory reduction protein 7 [Cyanobacteria bacterium P01_D01_bin.156]
MGNATMYSEDIFVLLIPGNEEVFLEPDELLAKLQAMLTEYTGVMPRELEKLGSLEEKATHLRDTACEFEVTPGVSWQWYAVRLEK